MTQRQKNFKSFQHRDSSPEDLLWLRPADFTLLKLPRPIILIGGAFDLLHRSHMRLIFAAAEKAEGGTLVCALDSDAKIKREKGLGRPILDWVERATTLNYMPINAITEIDTDEDMKTLVAGLRPDLRVLGMEYRGKPSRFSVKTMLVRAGNIHTSELVRRAAKAALMQRMLPEAK